MASSSQNGSSSNGGVYSSTGNDQGMEMFTALIRTACAQQANGMHHIFDASPISGHNQVPTSTTQGLLFPDKTKLTFATPPADLMSFPQPRTDSVAKFPKDFSQQTDKAGIQTYSRNLITVNRSYIGYIFKTNVRVIHQWSGARDLLRCSEVPSDIKLSPHKEDLLAVACQNFGISVWQLSIATKEKSEDYKSLWPSSEDRDGLSPPTPSKSEVQELIYTKLLEIVIPAILVRWHISDDDVLAVVLARHTLDDQQLEDSICGKVVSFSISQAEKATWKGCQSTDQGRNALEQLEQASWSSSYVVHSSELSLATEFAVTDIALVNIAPGNPHQGTQVLFVADTSGKITIFPSTGHPKDFHPFNSMAPLSRVIYLGQTDSGACFLLLGCKANTSLSLWKVDPFDDHPSQLLQTLDFLFHPDEQAAGTEQSNQPDNNAGSPSKNFLFAKGPDGTKGFSMTRTNNLVNQIKIEVDESLQLLAIADSSAEVLYSLQLRTEEIEPPRFMYLHCYPLKEAIWDLALSTEESVDNSHDAELKPAGPELQVFCSQKKGVQMYRLPVETCRYSAPKMNIISGFHIGNMPEMQSLDQLEAHVPSQESGEKQEPANNFIGSTDIATDEVPTAILISPNTPEQEQDQQGGESPLLDNLQTLMGNNQMNTEEGESFTADIGNGAHQEVGLHTTETMQDGGESEPAEQTTNLHTPLLHSALSYPFSGPAQSASNNNSSTGEPSSSLSLSITREGSAGEISGSCMVIPISPSGASAIEGSGFQTMAVSDASAEEFHIPTPSPNQSVNAQSQVSSFILNSLASGDRSAGEPQYSSAPIVTPGPTVPAASPSVLSSLLPGENRQSSSSVPPTPIDQLPVPLQQLLKSIGQGADPDRSAGIATPEPSTGSSSTLLTSLPHHAHATTTHKEPSAAKRAATQGSMLIRRSLGVSSHSTEPYDFRADTMMEPAFKTAQNHSSVRPNEGPTGLTESQMQELKDHIARCVSNLAPVAPNNPVVEQANDDAVLELRNTLSQELSALRVTVSQSFADLLQNQGEALQTQLAQIMSLLRPTALENSTAEERRTKELSSQIGILLKKEVQSTLVPALARIVTHTVEINFLKPVQNSVTGTLQPHLEATIREAVNESSELLTRQLDKSSEKLVESVVKGCQQPLQNEFKKAFKEILIPAFQKAVNCMFQQINEALVKGLSTCPATGPVSGMAELRAEVKALTASIGDLRDMLVSVSSQVSRLQSQMVSLMGTTNSLVEWQVQLTAQSPARLALEAKPDHRPQLQQLIMQEKFEEAFTIVLGAKDVVLFVWLLEQLNGDHILSGNEPLLSQEVLLCSLQQLGMNLEHETTLKLNWLRDIAVVLNPDDQSIKSHTQQVLVDLKHNLQKLKPALQPADINSFKLVSHVIQSLGSSCT